MGFINRFFGKQLEQVMYDDVIRFFKEEPEESLHLEFKSGEKNMSELCQDVCAFLNSEGGLLIYGSPRDKGNKAVGPFYPTKKNVHEVNQSFLDRLDPISENIRYKQIPVHGGNIILIDVPKSDLFHQAIKSGFYIRSLEQSKPAGTKLIESRFQKKLIPDLKIKYKITKIPFFNLLSFDKGFELKIKVHNNSTVTTKNLRILTTLFNISRSKIGDEFIQPYNKYKRRKIFSLNYPLDEVSKGMQSPFNTEFSCSKICLIHIKAFSENNAHIEKLIFFDPKNQNVIEEKDSEGLLQEHYDKVLDSESINYSQSE